MPAYLPAHLLYTSDVPEVRFCHKKEMSKFRLKISFLLKKGLTFPKIYSILKIERTAKPLPEVFLWQKESHPGIYLAAGYFSYGDGGACAHGTV